MREAADEYARLVDEHLRLAQAGVSRVASRIGLWLAVAATAALLAPAVAPLDPTLHAAGDAFAAGCIVGAFLFILLARRWISVAALAGKAGRRRLGARSVVLTAKSAQEEAVWRGLVLGGLVDPLGRLGAITASRVVKPSLLLVSALQKAVSTALPSGPMSKSI